MEIASVKVYLLPQITKVNIKMTFKYRLFIKI